MDKTQLKNFVALAQTLNFTEVARREFISQPALTKQITRLEGELGVTLFHRTSHGVSLTFAGEEFYKYASDILDGMDRAEHHLEQIRKGRMGSLQISSVFGMENIIVDGITRFTKQYEDIAVSILCGTGIQQIMTINRKTCDVFFSFASLLESFPDLETIPLPEDYFAVYVNREDAAKIEAEGISYLNHLTNLLESSSEGPFLTNRTFAIMSALGLEMSNISYHPSNATILIAVQAGLGFSLLPSQMNFGILPDNIVKLPLTIAEARIERALGWNRSSKNLAVKHFVDIIRAGSEQRGSSQ